MLIRDWTPDDAGFVYDMYSRWEVQRYIGREPRVMADRAEADALIERWRELEPPLGVWAIHAKDDDRLLGTLLLKSIPASGDQTPLAPSGDIEIGWHLHPDAWGHGYAREAGARGLQHAFDSGIEHVVAVTNPDNAASRRLAEQIGMTHLGPTDRYYNVTCELFSVRRP